MYLSEPAEAEPPIVPDLADLSRFAPMRLGVRLEVNSPMMGSYATQRAFQEEARRFGLQGDTTDARAIFGRLLDQGLVLTENLRRRPNYRYTAKEYKRQYVDLSSGEHLALYLAHLKNSGFVEEASQYEAIQNTFTRLTGRTFSVGIDHLPELTQPEDSLQLFVTTTSGWHTSPLEFSGEGVAEALFLSALLTTRRQKVVLLDEPASNLHLNVQTNLIRALQSETDNQFLIVTHSPALVPPEHLSQVSRFHVQDGHTARASLQLADMERDEMLKIRKELRRSLDMRNLLFSRAVILVEGETELAAFPAWFEQIGFPLGSHDVAVYSVDGDTRFTTPLCFLQDFRIPWVIICDGPVIDRPDINGQVDIAFQLAKAGVPNIPALQGKGFTARKAALADLGVFTLAEQASGEIEHLALFREKEHEAVQEVGKSKARQAYYLAATYPPPAELTTLADNVRRYLEKVGALT